MQQPKFAYEDVKYAENPAMFERALDLYQLGKVGEISEDRRGYSATVQGSHPYIVNVSMRRVDEGDCTCYMGQHDKLCKHIFALALAVLHTSGKMKEVVSETNAPTDLPIARGLVTAGMQKLRRYTGPSRIWFSYQRTLATGAGMIAHAVSGLPPTKENAKYLWSVVGRIDKKLMNGVDDSDGVVGDCVGKIIEQLAGYVKEVHELEPIIRKYCDKKTNFCFEDDLRAML
jgi:SWIM zinc finger